MYFRAQNDYVALDIADADFVLCADDNSDLVVDQPLPEPVIQAIQVLRRYADQVA